MVLFLPVGGSPLLLPWLEVVELVLIAALVACTVLYWLRTSPVALERRQRHVESTVAGLGTQVDEIASQRAVWKAQGEALVEELQGYFERIERKRASAASAATRAERALENGPQGREMTRVEQIEDARARFGIV